MPVEPAPTDPSPLPHRHRWAIVSHHLTSEGVVAYARCPCGRHRITRTGPDSLVIHPH